MPRREPSPEVGCEAYTKDPYSVHYRKRCPNVRAVRINGHSYCKRHAALEALFLLMRDGKAKRIVRLEHCEYGPVTASEE